MKDILKINRAKWRTGVNGKNKTGRGSTKLLNYGGFMCCLGFDCLQSGISQRALKGYASPEAILKNPPNHLVNKSGYDNKFANKAININDNDETTPQEKEKLISDHYATIGVKIIFTGKYQK